MGSSVLSLFELIVSGEGKRTGDGPTRV